MKSISSEMDIKVALLEWSNITEAASHGLWDVIIGADCLFFKDFHFALIELLDQMLHKDGKILLFQPSRSGTMELFVERASSMFDVRVEDNYSRKVMSPQSRSASQCASFALDSHRS
jgi:predicted nicotinamide N-methyase